jgi:hypothetical protein
VSYHIVFMSAEIFLPLFILAGVLSTALRLDDDDEDRQEVRHSVSQLARPSFNRSAVLLQSDSHSESTVFRSAGYARNCEQQPVFSGEIGLGPFAPRSDNERKWTELEVTKFEPRKPKVAFLMFVKDGAMINNVHMWEAWMKHAREEEGIDFAMHVHIKKEYQNTFRKYSVPFWVPTSWCDMFDAEMMLMREALQDPNVTHLMTLSSNSIPLKSLSFIYKEIEQQPATRMCIDHEFKRFGGLRKKSPRAESWWLMRRSEALPFINNQDLVRDTFKYRNKSDCGDENTWALALLLRKSRWKAEVELVDECPMFTDWKDSCKDWAKKSDDACKNCVNLRQEPHTDANVGHPRTYTHVGVKAWHELVETPFWFGRKFDDNAFLQIVDPWPLKPPPPLSAAQVANPAATAAAASVAKVEAAVATAAAMAAPS